MPKVSFEMESITVEIPQGATFYDAALKAGIVLQRGFPAAHPCNANGFCGGQACAVMVRSPDPKAVTPPTWKERWLHGVLIKAKKRLACQCTPLRDLTIVTMP